MFSELSTAARDVVVERRRQIEVEGFTPEYDLEEHAAGDLALAALCYLQAIGERASMTSEEMLRRHPPDLWPWDDEWWKPKNNRRDLVRAAALIIAEIERIDRRAATGLLRG